VEVRQDFDNYLVLIRVEPGKPFVYYMGAAWDKVSIFMIGRPGRPM